MQQKLIFSVFLALVELALAVTKRTAAVSVRNNSDKPLVGVSVIHKYGNNYKNQQQWGIVQPGKLGSEHLTAEYNTGAFTTGRDWWFVSFYSPDMKMLYYSDPDNVRDIVDKLEGVAPDAMAAAAGAMAALPSSLSGPGSVAAAIAAAVAAKSTTSSLFNSEGTAGFKQHILRSEDEAGLTEIVINSDYTITFKSKSGTSDTVTSHKPVTVSTEQHDTEMSHEPAMGSNEQ